METFLTILIVVAGLAVVGPVLARLVVAYRKTLQEIETMEILARHARDEGEQALQKATATDGTLERLLAERAQLEARLQPLEECISPKALAERERLYLAHDRFSSWDEEYIAVVTNPTMDTTTFHPLAVESWSRGRPNVFWASDLTHARATVESRFPITLGYELVSISVSKNRVLDPAEQSQAGSANSSGAPG